MGEQRKNPKERTTKRLLRTFRKLVNPAGAHYDAYDPPPEEHSFVLCPNESLAVVTISSHGYTGWFAFRNSARISTELEHRGFGHWSAPHKCTLSCRLPIEEALLWARSNIYDPGSRSELARTGYLTLRSTSDRSDQEVITFFRSEITIVSNPVNRLIDEIDERCGHLLLMRHR